MIWEIVIAGAAIAWAYYAFDHELGIVLPYMMGVIYMPTWDAFGMLTMLMLMFSLARKAFKSAVS
jgi:hypothetical protein